MPPRRLGEGKSKVLILRIPIETWLKLLEREKRLDIPAREQIRNAVYTFLERVDGTTKTQHTAK